MTKRFLLLPASFFLALIFFSFTGAPDHYDYDTDLLTPQFHQGRPQALRDLLPDSSVAVFFASPVRTRSNDVEYDYHQDPNLFYLTGLCEPNAMLIVFKEKQQVDTMFTNELLFVQDRDPKEEAWTGKRLGADGAKQLLGIDKVLSSKDFSPSMIKWKKFHTVFFFPLTGEMNDHPDDPCDLSLLLAKFSNSTKRNSNDDTERLSEYMAMLREVKQPEELELMRKAILISGDGHTELMKALEPDMTEYQAQAILEFRFKMEGAEFPAYPSICGSGENSCILHYTSNRRPFQDGDLIVVDAGAEYHGYCADITRTLPVNGKFSAEQKQIYDIVYDAQQAGIQACRIGNEFRAPHNAAVEVIKKRLLALGIIQNEEDYIRYFFHGTSHYLGLDVHDAGLNGRLALGNVITVEPGIYIPAGSPCDPKWWNIGVRIEDDVLITSGDPEVLSGNIPKTTTDIEAMMAQKSYLNESGGPR
ncbi:MAG TPA: aminopeptidase P N-terminal domain-containing protein [Bacteroidia bacterium]|nr:aminopeptidase P N-terminal domain-containing protein [Bacteroidia bacterium]